jgi:WD40 repeat protein
MIDWTGDNGFAVAWSPDGSRFAINNENRQLRIRDGETGELIEILDSGMESRETAYTDYHDSLAWNPNGTMFAEAGQDGIVRIWDAETYELITTLDFTE